MLNEARQAQLQSSGIVSGTLHKQLVRAVLLATLALVSPFTAGQPVDILKPDANSVLCQGQPAVPDCFGAEPISLSFQDVEIRPLLQMIASMAEVNLVVGDGVTGRITLHLKDLLWQQVLDFILISKGLAKRQVGKVLIVDTQETIAAQEKLALERLKRSVELTPLHTEHLAILHADAGKVASLLTKTSKGAGQLLSLRGSILVDSRTNKVIVTDTKERIAIIRQVLQGIDIPVRQVLIEARIVTANTSFSRQLGVRWGGLGFSTNGNRVIGGSREGLASVMDGRATGSSAPLNVDLGLGPNPTSQFTLGFLGSRFILDLELSALASEGQGEIVARPKIVTADKQSAVITSGVEIPFQEVSTSGSTAITFKQAVMELEVRPRITPDNRIDMDLKVSQDAPGRVINGVPLINTNRIHTKVVVNNGETLVLGGVYRFRSTKSVTKTPLLGDIPILRRLFRRTVNMKERQELLIFITPKIIRNVDDVSADWRKAS